MFDGQGDRKYLNGPERRAYLRAVLQEPDLLNQTFCLTLFYTGCRISEALQLTLGRIDLEGGSLIFETLKRRKRGHFRSIPIPDPLVRQFRRLTSKGTSLHVVWPYSRVTAYRIIKQRMKEAQIKGAKACPKGLRHSFAITCLEEKIPLTTVKKWLGHARIETTAIYLDAVGTEERNLARRLWRNISNCRRARGNRNMH